MSEEIDAFEAGPVITSGPGKIFWSSASDPATFGTLDGVNFHVLAVPFAHENWRDRLGLWLLKGRRRGVRVTALHESRGSALEITLTAEQIGPWL